MFDPLARALGPYQTIKHFCQTLEKCLSVKTFTVWPCRKTSLEHCLQKHFLFSSIKNELFEFFKKITQQIFLLLLAKQCFVM